MPGILSLVSKIMRHSLYNHLLILHLRMIDGRNMVVIRVGMRRWRLVAEMEMMKMKEMKMKTLERLTVTMIRNLGRTLTALL
jgi:hypothetical protein